ncbi:MAG: peptidoglycan DD-metalloendopeptidase family protein [Alphaproteobacteria bacterium]|nr:peptidoglycan DD-metalloendopeptidase family protein [Alphaproteobacteria bacterium]
MLKFVLALAILCGGANSVFAAGATSELDKIQTQIRQTEQKNKQLEQQVKTSDRDVAKTKKQLVTAADKVSSLEELRGALVKKIAELDERRDALATELEKNRARVSDAAAGMLFIAANPSFDSDNMHEFVLTSAVLAGMSDSFDEQIVDAGEKIAELDKILNERAIEKEKLDRTAKKYTDEKNLLDKLLRRRSAQNEKLRSEHMATQQKLRELSARAKSISELSAGVGSSEMSSDAHFSIRKLNQPVRGRVIVHFGEKTALGLKSDGWRIRTGSDALVTAPADGVVKFADSFKGFGRVIIISHKNGYNTVMTNLGNIDVVVGQEVLGGEPVGRMNPNKPEMYLEVRRGDKAIDPARLFKEN